MSSSSSSNSEKPVLLKRQVTDVETNTQPALDPLAAFDAVASEIRAISAARVDRIVSLLDRIGATLDFDDDEA